MKKQESNRLSMKSISRREFIKYSSAGVLGAAFSFGTHSCKGSGKKPNFVFFLTDDQRWDAMSCVGNKMLQTPNMDRIAGEGIRFENMFVATSLCGPSRASFLTGKYVHNHGVRRNGEALSLEHKTFPEILKEAGYETAFIGKWHNTDQGKGRGFDYTFGFEGQGRYHDPIVSENFGPFMEYEGHVTDVLTDHAIKFLEKEHEGPFCLLLWFKAPHRSWLPAKRFESLYDDIKMPEPLTFNDTYDGRPEAVRNADMKIGDFDDVPDLDTFLKNYYRTLVGVDENVGRVLDVLERLGYEKNTVVIYSSDNGFFLGEHHFFDKRLMYEPSIRIPLLVKYPKMIRPGTTNQDMVLNVDIAPTILDLAGVPVPENVDGKSIKSLLQGKSIPWRSEFLYEYYEYPAVHMVRKNRGIRTKRWKYIHYFEEPQEFELYDIQNDPHEVNNLYGNPAFKDVFEQLRVRLVEIRRELKDPDF
jgi:arylsulfatase A-like enzyme